MADGGEPIRLFSGPLSMFGAKAQTAVLEKCLEVEPVMVPFGMERLYEPKHPEVVRINPKRQVLVLVHGTLEIFDSTQIFEYLEDLRPEPALWPAGIAERARARLLELKSDEVFFPHVIRLMGRTTRLPLRRAMARPAITGRWRRCSPIASSSPAPIPSPTSPSTWRSCSESEWARRSPRRPRSFCNGATA
jgi:glutathione S-transferase